MQDRFVGDIGDYGKYGLLRHLCGLREGVEGPALSLGVVWYFNPSDGGPGGGLLDYLMNPERYRPCDPILFHTLFWIAVSNRRSVARVGDSEILPRATRFFDEHVPPDGENRKGWLNRALAETRHCSLAFLDPDNGLANNSHSDDRPSRKHVYLDEVTRFASQTRSVVVYHHLGRQNHSRDINGQAASLRDVGVDKLWVLRFKRISPRAFFVIPGMDHAELLARRLDRFLQGPWGDHFERCRV
jgi:hypothetical protein